MNLDQYIFETLIASAFLLQELHLLIQLIDQYAVLGTKARLEPLDARHMHHNELTFLAVIVAFELNLSSTSLPNGNGGGGDVYLSFEDGCPASRSWKRVVAYGA